MLVDMALQHKPGFDWGPACRESCQHCCTQLCTEHQSQIDKGTIRIVLLMNQHFWNLEWILIINATVYSFMAHFAHQFAKLSGSLF